MTTQLTTETFAKSIQNGVSFIDLGRSGAHLVG